MIPKKLHYIWIGPYQETLEFYSDWKTSLPDHDLHIWNNDNIKPYLDQINTDLGWDIIKNKYFTYISDLLRLYILRDHGGIYLDHDMIVVKNFEELLNNKRFMTTFQFSDANKEQTLQELNHDAARLKNLEHPMVRQQYANPCIIASEPGCEILTNSINKIIANEHRENKYILSDWVTGPQAMTETLIEFGLDLKRCETVEKDGVIVYHKNLFHPVHMMQRLRHGDNNMQKLIDEICKNKSAYTIHYHHNFGLEVQNTDDPTYSVKKDLCNYGDWFTKAYC